MAIQQRTIADDIAVIRATYQIETTCLAGNPTLDTLSEPAQAFYRGKYDAAVLAVRAYGYQAEDLDGAEAIVADPHLLAYYVPQMQTDMLAPREPLGISEPLYRIVTRDRMPIVEVSEHADAPFQPIEKHMEPLAYYVIVAAGGNFEAEQVYVVPPWFPQYCQ